MDTGLKVYRNYFKIPHGLQLDCKYGVLYPVFRKIMYPGDVFKINAELLIRYQPMLAPPMNDCVATVRFAFVPLRLDEENTELIVTGSNDGHLSEETLPVMDSVFKYLDTTGDSHPVNEKHSILDYMCQIPAISTSLTDALKAKLEASKGSPAAYFPKSYYRFWWDFYRDENLYTAYSDFDDFWDVMKTKLNRADVSLMPTNLRKDRLTSSLPWQLKANAAPRVPIQALASGGSAVFNFGEIKEDSEHFSYNDLVAAGDDADFANMRQLRFNGTSEGGKRPFLISESQPTRSVWSEEVSRFSNKMTNVLNNNNTIVGTEFEAAGFTAADVRDVMAQTRIYERLARCGSRYTEYLLP